MHRVASTTIGEVHHGLTGSRFRGAVSLLFGEFFCARFSKVVSQRECQEGSDYCDRGHSTDLGPAWRDSGVDDVCSELKSQSCHQPSSKHQPEFEGCRATVLPQYQCGHSYQRLQYADRDYGNRDHFDREADGQCNLLYQTLHELRASATERMTNEPVD
jgi:hypothetical protein